MCARVDHQFGLIVDALKEALTGISLYEAQNNRSHNYLWSLYIAASVHLEKGNLAEAETLANKGIDTNPDHLDSHYILAAIAFRRKNRLQFENRMNEYGLHRINIVE